MQKETKKLLSYLLILLLLFTTLLTDSTITQAATIKNNGTVISSNNITIDTSSGQTVYNVTENIQNGLEIELANGETAVLDGNNHQVTGKNADGSNPATPGLTVKGSGTLIIKNITFKGGDGSSSYESASPGISVESSTVNIRFEGTVKATGGTGYTGKIGEPNSNGGTGGKGGDALSFNGKVLDIANSTTLTLNGGSGGTGGNLPSQCEPYNKGGTGGTGGNALSFTGDALNIANSTLTLTGGDAGNAGNGGTSPTGGNGGIALNFDGKVLDIANGTALTLKGGNGGAGYNNGSKGYDFEYKKGCVSQSLYSISALFYTNHNVNKRLSLTLTYPDSNNGSSVTKQYYTSSSTKTTLSELCDLVNLPNTNNNWAKSDDTPVSADTLKLNTALNLSYKGHIVKFDTNGGSAVTSQLVTPNSTATKPTNPTREGYTFSDWFTDVDCTQSYDFDKNVTEDITLYAKWTINSYTVTFNTNDGSAVEQKSVEYNSKVTQPADPTKSGYKFDGWFTDTDCKTSYDFNTPVIKDITLYAKWDKIAAPDISLNYQVTFETNGGSNIAPLSVKADTAVKTPAKPTKANCGFGGWFTDKNCTQSYNFAAPVKGDITLYAKWYTVKLNVDSVTLQKGQTASVIKATVNKGDSVKSFTSSNITKVTVNEKGKLKGIRQGTATITVKTQKGAAATFTVKVQKSKVLTKKITITNPETDTITLNKRKTINLKVALTPITSQEKIVYSIKNKEIAKITKQGNNVFKITAKKKGTTSITIKSGSKSVSIDLEVK